jgi:type IV pilus assembly protein PilA
MRHADREAGFTLIELLVVMLILGVLAAIALPLFISQKDRAYDAEAKSTAHSAELAMEACATDHNSYDPAECDAEGLHAIEPTLPTGLESPLAVSPEGDGYRIDVESAITENVFSIVRLPGGASLYPCTVTGSEHGGCEVAEGNVGIWRR